jgi:hypothetical protein
MPSFWSAVANSEWKTRRSKSMPSASVPSKALLGHHHAGAAQGADRRCCGQGFFEQLVQRHDARDEPGALGLLCIDQTAGEHHVHGLALAHRARQPLRATGAGQDADLDLGLAKARVLGSDDEVAHHRQLAATTECKAGHRGDHRFAHLANAFPVAGDEATLVHIHESQLRHRRDVGAGGKGFVAAGDDDAADTVVAIGRAQRSAEFIHQRVVECVQLFRPVQCQQCDMTLACAAPLSQDQRAGGFDHGGSEDW